MAFYTGKGDEGESYIKGKKMKKSEPVFDAIGDIDELNTVLGICVSNIDDEHVVRVLTNIQGKLFSLGVDILFSDIKKNVAFEDTKMLEDEIKEFEGMVKQPKRFILPRGISGAEYLHNARAVARRAERSILKVKFSGVNTKKINSYITPYINRLSSLLFVMALYLNEKEGFEEINPEY